MAYLLVLRSVETGPQLGSMVFTGKIEHEGGSEVMRPFTS